MTDYSVLKRLAEAAAKHGWYQAGAFGLSRITGEAEESFVVAASPAAVLLLIADNERLHESDQEATELCDTLSVLLGEIAVEVRGPEEPKSRHGFHDLPSRVKTVVAERDQLKAENERLRADYAGLARFNPEWDRVAAAQDLVREHMAMVVQLKAEIAGLKTGYEAYEQVNAELKAENERLERNRDMWKGQVERQSEMLRLAHEADKLLKAECEGLPKHAPSSEIIWCACGDGYPVNSYGAGFMAANGDVCENCDAANGRVEPHLDTPDELKALRQALTDIFNHVEGNTECLVRDLVNWGTPRINPNDFYDECEAIKEIANAALGQGGQS